MSEIVLTAAEKAGLYFIPPASGGKAVPEEIQQRLQDLGLITAPRQDGRRWMTLLGDKVRLGTVQFTVKD